MLETLPQTEHEAITLDEATQIILEKIPPLNSNEQLRVVSIYQRCFRANVWERISNGCCSDNRIVCSYFVTIRPNEVIVEKEKSRKEQ